MWIRHRNADFFALKVFWPKVRDFRENRELLIGCFFHCSFMTGDGASSRDLSVCGDSIFDGGELPAVAGGIDHGLSAKSLQARLAGHDEIRDPPFLDQGVQEKAVQLELCPGLQDHLLRDVL